MPWSDFEVRHRNPDGRLEPPELRRPPREEDGLAAWVAAVHARIADLAPRGRGFADEVVELREAVDQPCADLFDMRLAGGRAGIIPVYVRRGWRGASEPTSYGALGDVGLKPQTPSLAALRVGQVARLRNGRQRVEDDYAVVVNGFTTDARGSRRYVCGVVSFYAHERKRAPYVGQVHVTKKQCARMRYMDKKRDRRLKRMRKVYVPTSERW